MNECGVWHYSYFPIWMIAVILRKVLFVSRCFSKLLFSRFYTLFLFLVDTLSFFMQWYFMNLNLYVSVMPGFSLWYQCPTTDPSLLTTLNVDSFYSLYRIFEGFQGLFIIFSLFLNWLWLLSFSSSGY